MNTYIHSSSTMEAAGFRYIEQGDTVRCDKCTLEVSHWTSNMNPFLIHSERSPHCEFVRQRFSSPNENISQITSIDEQRPLKRQKIEASCSSFELNKLKEIRHRSFSIWPHTAPCRSQMIKAGFFSCNINDRVICIYCDLICEQWINKIDDPCEAHKILSPNCQFVKSVLVHDDNNIKFILPIHNDYIDIKKRHASFSTLSNIDLSFIEKLAEAGFFYTDNKILCFYCNGSINNWKSNNHHHPIVEHIRYFPYCTYAQQLCGDDLYDKIQEDVENNKTINDQQQIDILDDELLSYEIKARLDLPISNRLLEKFHISIIKICWKNQLEKKHDDRITHSDLYIQCIIIQKHDELINKKKKKIIIPSKEIKNIIYFNNKQLSSSILLNNENQLLTGIFASFENDFQQYKNNRKILSKQFKEKIEITIQREQSLINWTYSNPSRFDVVKGGWIYNEKENYLICPHCHIQYHQWKTNDNLYLIHCYLSPLCLFVLSSNPFHLKSIPIKTVQEQFTNDNIITASSQLYNGLVQSKYSFISQLTNRVKSFDRCPDVCPNTVYELAESGFYCTNFHRFLKCFYCQRITFGKNLNSQFIEYIKHRHISSSCPYNQQLNDCNPTSLSIQQTTINCVWCMNKEKQLVALPCRHFSLCKSCGEITRTCPICQKLIDTYFIIYSS